MIDDFMDKINDTAKAMDVKMWFLSVYGCDGCKRVTIVFVVIVSIGAIFATVALLWPSSTTKPDLSSSRFIIVRVPENGVAVRVDQGEPFVGLTDLAVSPDGYLYSGNDSKIFRISLFTGEVNTFLTKVPSGIDRSLWSDSDAEFCCGIAVDRHCNLYLANYSACFVIAPNGELLEWHSTRTMKDIPPLRLSSHSGTTHPTVVVRGCPIAVSQIESYVAFFNISQSEPFH